MIIYVVKWNENGKQKFATSSYSKAKEKYLNLVFKAKEGEDLEIGTLEEAVLKIDISKKGDVIDVLNKEL